MEISITMLSLLKVFVGSLVAEGYFSWDKIDSCEYTDRPQPKQTKPNVHQLVASGNMVNKYLPEVC